MSPQHRRDPIPVWESVLVITCSLGVLAVMGTLIYVLIRVMGETP